MRKLTLKHAADTALLLLWGPIFVNDTKTQLHPPQPIHQCLHICHIRTWYMGQKGLKILGLILAASMKNSRTALHKRWHWQVAAIQMSVWIIYHCYLQLELQPGLPILRPKSYQSREWWSRNSEEKGTEWKCLIYDSIPSMSPHHYRNIAMKTHLSKASNQLAALT